MDDQKDIRWKQRFENYERAFILLESAIKEGTNNMLERAGLIQFFEMSLNWHGKSLKIISKPMAPK